MTDASYHALEILTYAVDALAATDNVRARLFEASMDLLRVRADQLPDEQMRRDFERIRTKLTPRYSDRQRGDGGRDAAQYQRRGRGDHRPPHPRPAPRALRSADALSPRGRARHLLDELENSGC